MENVNLTYFEDKLFNLWGVDLSFTLQGRWENANTFLFGLDDDTYVALEDPDDGYRSRLDCMLKLPGKLRLSNTFPSVKVRGRLSCNSTRDILELVDIMTNKVVLQVGTENTDDYYPYFISEFNPENMVSNA